eukprot:610836-Prymnesium_polylepis.1
MLHLDARTSASMILARTSRESAAPRHTCAPTVADCVCDATLKQPWLWRAAHQAFRVDVDTL